MSKDGELYGEGRLEALLGKAADTGLSPEPLVKVVRADVASFAQGAEQSDDITILSLKVESCAE